MPVASLLLPLLKYAGIPLATALVAKVGGKIAAKQIAKNALANRGVGRPSLLSAAKTARAVNAANKVSGAGGAALDLIKGAVGGGLGLAGNLVQAGGVGAGALMGAAGQMPSAFTNMGSTERSRAVYGDTPAVAAAKFAAPLGAAAGVATSALTGAVGGTLSDWGKTMRLSSMQSGLTRKANEFGEQIKGRYSPEELDAIEQYMRTQGIPYQTKGFSL